MVKRGLGKGFDSLIPTNILNSDFDTTAAEDERVSSMRLLPLEDIVPDPDQPRRIFDPDELRSLADSIKEHGLLQPIVVTPKGKQFEIVAGERRYRAAKLAGLTKLQAIVRTLSAQHRLEVSIIENVQRADLNPLEMATSYLKLKTQFNLTDKQIAERIGKAGSTINNQLRLLALPDEAKKALVDGKIVEGHARQILALPDHATQLELLDNIIKHGWTVRKAEQFVVGYKQAGKAGDNKAGLETAKKAVRSETDFTRELAKRLGFKEKSVMQKTMAHGGQIIIRYKDDADIARIGQLLGL